jgi:hypothetical protein
MILEKTSQFVQNPEIKIKIDKKAGFNSIVFCALFYK